MSELLDKIIEATEKRGVEEFKRSLEDEELLVNYKEFNGEEVPEDDDYYEKDEDTEKVFYNYVNKRLLRGVRAKLGQIEYQLEHFYPVSKVRFISSSLTSLIKGFNKNFDSSEFLFYNLHNQDFLSLKASVFTIASIHDCSDANLNKLFYYFAHCEDEYLPEYEKALRYALNPSISEKLLSILPFCSDSVFESGLKILAFRNDITMEDWRQLTSNKKGDFKYFGMLERVKLNDSDALEYIKKNDSEKFHVERLLLLLANGSNEILDQCRDKVKNGSIVPYHVKLIGLSGNRSDIIHLVRLYKKTEPELKKAIIETLGAFQCVESMEFFLEILEEEEFTEQIFKEILVFTGIDFLEKESPAEEFRKWCENELFKYREKRIYHGEEWSHKSHIKELRNEDNNSERRIFLWNELLARSECKIMFNPSWPLEQQEKAINKLDHWFETENPGLQNPWNYGVN